MEEPPREINKIKQDDKRTHLYDRIFNTSEHFGMNIRMFLTYEYEFCQFEDVSTIQISSVMIKIMKSYPSTKIKNKNKPISGGFRMKNPRTRAACSVLPNNQVPTPTPD